MTKLVRESASSGIRNTIQAVYLGAVHNVTTSGSSAQSGAVGADTTLVRLVATEACYVAIGDNPTATSSSMYLPAATPEYFGIGGGQKVAALQVASGGVLNVTEAA
jgi:hypothetical protein